ncbi:MAG: hypothetical protein ABSH09_04070 [Bryobacteraceae bacterium]
MAVWDETPHMLAMALLPLAVVFLALAIQKGTLFRYAGAVATIVAMTLASTFGPIEAAMVSIFLLRVADQRWIKHKIMLIGTLGITWYLCLCYERVFIAAFVDFGGACGVGARGETGMEFSLSDCSRDSGLRLDCPVAVASKMEPEPLVSVYRLVCIHGELPSAHRNVFSPGVVAPTGSLQNRNGSWAGARGGFWFVAFSPEVAAVNRVWVAVLASFARCGTRCKPSTICKGDSEFCRHKADNRIPRGRVDTGKFAGCASYDARLYCAVDKCIHRRAAIFWKFLKHGIQSGTTESS